MGRSCQYTLLHSPPFDLHLHLTAPGLKDRCRPGHLRSAVTGKWTVRPRFPKKLWISKKVWCCPHIMRRTRKYRPEIVVQTSSVYTHSHNSTEKTWPLISFTATPLFLPVSPALSLLYITHHF